MNNYRTAPNTAPKHKKAEATVWQLPLPNQSRHSDSNRGPAVYKTAALPLSYAGEAYVLYHGGRNIVKRHIARRCKLNLH